MERLPVKNREPCTPPEPTKCSKLARNDPPSATEAVGARSTKPARPTSQRATLWPSTTPSFGAAIAAKWPPDCSILIIGLESVTSLASQLARTSTLARTASSQERGGNSRSANSWPSVSNNLSCKPSRTRSTVARCRVSVCSEVSRLSWSWMSWVSGHVEEPTIRTTPKPPSNTSWRSTEAAA